LGRGLFRRYFYNGAGFAIAFGEELPLFIVHCSLIIEKHTPAITQQTIAIYLYIRILHLLIV